MKIIQISEVSGEPQRKVKLIPVHEIDEHRAFLRNEFLEYFGSGNGYSRTSNGKPNPVTQEFRNVQSQLNALRNEKLSIKDKQKEANVLVNNFKAWLRTKNIRYRDLWRSLQVPDFRGE